MDKGQQTLLTKGHVINNLDLAGHTVSVTANQLCCCNVKAAIGNTEINKSGCVAVKFYWNLNFM